MDIDLIKTGALRQLDDCVQMRVMAVDAAVAHQAHQMQRGAVRLAVFDRAEQSLVLEEVAVLDRLRDAGQLLIDDAASADVRVTDFAVAHLPVRQADVHAGRADVGHRTGFHQFIQTGRVSGDNGVAVIAFILAEAVHDAKQYRFFHSINLFSF